MAGLSLLTGCAYFRTEKSHYAGTDRMLARGDYPAAIQKIETAKHKEYVRKDRAIYYLDMGMLRHFNGDYEQSNTFLELAERTIEENFTKSLSLSAGSLLMNDNVLPYAGEVYEDIYLNVFKALNYLALGQTDEAFVEVRRINHKLNLLEDKYAKIARKLNEAEEAQETFSPGRNRFLSSALGRYLSLLLYRNEGKWDDVRIDREGIDRAWKLQPGIYTFPKPVLSTATEPVYPPLARLNVLAFSGRCPEKTAETLYLHTEEELVVVAATSDDYWTGPFILPWPGVPLGYHFKFQLPRMRMQPSGVARIEVELGAEKPVLMHRIESLENTALETFEIKKPLIYLKTLTRAVAKGLASEAGKAEMVEDMEDDLFSFALRILTDLAVDMTENADLRMARFFPANAYIRELHVKEGSYPLKIHYYGYGGELLRTDDQGNIEIRAGRLNVIQSAHLD